MPKLKKIDITFNNEIGYRSFEVVLFVSASGLFYTNLDIEYLPSIESVLNKKDYLPTAKNKIKVTNKNLDNLIDKLESIFKIHSSPTIKKENIIIYNIKTDISFVEDKHGEIYPNGNYVKNYGEDAFWNDNDKYGGHHASNPSEGGYSLTIGAKAKTKITYTYGDTEVVKYEAYYGENGSHHGRINPAEKLNSWCSFTLPSNALEIPYSDKSALFFYNFMYGMANISKIIQDSTFDKNDLLRLIQSGNNMLSSPSNKVTNDL